MGLSKSKTTIKTIANELNISVSTVSRAFTTPTAVKASTLRKIKEVSQRLNYTPNYNARALVQKKSRIIGVILQSLRNQPIDSLVRQATNLLSAKGYDIHVFVTYDNDQLNEEALTCCLCRGYDGVIINNSSFEGRMEAIETLIERKTPFVVLGQYNYSPADQVIGDFKLAGMVMTKHLIKLGHKNIAFVTNSNCDPRYDGYLNMLHQHKIPVQPELFFNCPCEQDSLNKIAKKIMETNATAVFANYDQMAMRLIRSFKNINVKVPEQISVVGVGNELYSDLISPPLTTFEIDTEHLADNLVDTLFERIENPDKPTKTVLLNGKIVIRESSEKLSK